MTQAYRSPSCSRASTSIDLTQPLSEDTPVLQLPAAVREHAGPRRATRSARYDDRGPAWAWYWLEIGEHVGTHFDAPIHWVTGTRRRGRRLGAGGAARRPRGRDRQVGRGGAGPRLPARPSTTCARSRPSTGRCPTAAGCCSAPAGTPARTTRRRSSTPTRRARTRPGFDAECARWHGDGDRPRRRRRRDGRHRRGRRALVRPAVPVHHFLLGAGKYGLTQLANLGAAAADRRGADRGAAAARRRHRQPGARARARAADRCSRSRIVVD